MFQPLPLRYLEVAHVLLKDAKDTFAAEEYWKVLEIVRCASQYPGGSQVIMGFVHTFHVGERSQCADHLLLGQ